MYRQIGQFDPDRRFFSWIYRIAVNTCLQTQRRPATTTLDAQPLVDPQPEPAAAAEQAEVRQALQAALAALPDRERQVIGLRYGWR